MRTVNNNLIKILPLKRLIFAFSKQYRKQNSGFFSKNQKHFNTLFELAIESYQI